MRWFLAAGGMGLLIAWFACWAVTVMPGTPAVSVQWVAGNLLAFAAGLAFGAMACLGWRKAAPTDTTHSEEFVPVREITPYVEEHAIKPNEDGNWMKSAKTLDSLFARLLTELSYDEYLRELRSVEDHFLRLREGSPRLMLETQRRVAERALDGAVSKEQPYEECRARFDRLWELGFTTIGQEFTYVSVFSQYCRDTGRTRESLAVINTFQEKLRSLLKFATSFQEALSRES